MDEPSTGKGKVTLLSSPITPSLIVVLLIMFITIFKQQKQIPRRRRRRSRGRGKMTKKHRGNRGDKVWSGNGEPGMWEIPGARLESGLRGACSLFGLFLRARLLIGFNVVDVFVFNVVVGLIKQRSPSASNKCPIELESCTFHTNKHTHSPRSFWPKISVYQCEPPPPSPHQQ